MTEELGKRFEFPNSLIQSQAVSHLIASVLKENVSSEKICQSSNQSPALNVLWEKCCSDHVVVRTACCEALVTLVAQDHADFNYVLNGLLNLIPSARNVQGLVKSIGKLLQMQVLRTEKHGAGFSLCSYAVRNPPHPFITVLENRSECWPIILQQLSIYLHQCPEWAQSTSVSMMAPFLRYLYCEPAQPRQHAELRISLLKVFLKPHSLKDSDRPSELEQCILQLFCSLTPHLQLNDLMQVTEATMFFEELSAALQRYPTFWNSKLCQLSLQLLCISEVSLRITGDCSSLIHVIERNANLLKEDFPADQILIGVGVLLLQTPASQQKPILALAKQILSSSKVHGIPTLAPVLVMPLLQILSSTATAACNFQEDAATSRHQLAVTLLEMIQNECKMGKPEQSPWKVTFPITSWYNSLYTTWRIAEAMKEDGTAVRDWLSSIKSLLPIMSEVPTHVSLLLAYLLVHMEGETLRDVLSVLTQVAETDSSQVPNLVPVLMFKLGRPLEPMLYRDILYTLPTLGTHKVCVAQILRAIQVLGSTPKLRAIALRLMTSLWEKQDRVYSELQKFMAVSDMSSQLIGKEVLWEKTIAKAASIRDICRQRPYQHGADMLAAVSQVLNECSKPDQATPAALVLQGLHALCQAEVVDIRSTWNALCSKLSCDTRPLILKTLHEFFALVPSLMVKTEEYEKFKASVVSFLWNNTQSKDQLVATTAYQALSKFNSEEHTILHLPEQARPEVPPPDEVDMAEDEEEKEVDLSVPGSSYIKLMMLTAPVVLPAFKDFAASLVQQEMANIPRGVYHSALRGGSTRSDHGKTVAGVPNFMLKMYEKNKQPGLKPGLAAGMLMCYDLPIQTDRDGRPINRFLASRGRSYQQMLTALIHEVSIQPSDWHRSIVLPQSWLAFMNRTYHAVLQMCPKERKNAGESFWRCMKKLHH